MFDPYAVLFGEPASDHRAMAGMIEDLGGVATGVLGGQHPRPFADPLTIVLGVLDLPQLRSRREFEMVLVGDPRLDQRRLQPRNSCRNDSLSKP